MGSFLNQTTFCPSCGGTGYTDVEDKNSRAKCADCQGNGVFISQSDTLLYFGSSAYFDFAKREKIKTLRSIYLITAGVMIIAAIVILVYLYNLGNSMVNTTNLQPF